jgi:hypothetical protein
VGESRPSWRDGGTPGLEERFCSTTVRGVDRMEAADIDIERSWEVRSRRGPDIFGTVRADSDDRREAKAGEWSTIVTERSVWDVALVTEERIDE